MNRNEYMKRLLDSYNSGKISVEAYDVAIENADIFCDDEEEEEYFNIPRTYAEIEYDDFDNPEAILGARFDDMNYLHYRER